VSADRWHTASAAPFTSGVESYPLRTAARTTSIVDK
jgi:hypothetical protein